MLWFGLVLVGVMHLTRRACLSFGLCAFSLSCRSGVVLLGSAVSLLQLSNGCDLASVFPLAQFQAPLHSQPGRVLVVWLRLVRFGSGLWC